jgi:hypothetical protein
MTFRKFITDYFGTVRAFSEHLGIAYSTAYEWLHKPDKITAERIIDLSKHSGVSECEIVDIIKRTVNGDK